MLTVVYGASGSGKSEFAEEICQKYTNDKYYIATMQPFGKEGEKRIARHRKLREGKGFATLEQYVDLHKLKIEHGQVALLECMSNLVANEIFRKDPQEDVVLSILQGIHHLLENTHHLVIVTNDVFADGMIYEEETRSYMEVLAKVNKELFALADEVYEVVVGIGIKIK